MYNDCPFVTNGSITIKEKTCEQLDETKICEIPYSEFDSDYLCDDIVIEENTLLLEFVVGFECIYIVYTIIKIIVSIIILILYMTNSDNCLSCCKKVSNDDEVKDEEIEMNEEPEVVMANVN